MDTDELAIVPVALAQAMFNTNTLFRILVEARNRDAIETAKRAGDARSSSSATTARRTSPSSRRTRCSPLSTACSARSRCGVAGIAAISLAVAGILVMNVMLVSVAQRTARSAC